MTEHFQGKSITHITASDSSGISRSTFPQLETMCCSEDRKLCYRNSASIDGKLAAGRGEEIESAVLKEIPLPADNHSQFNAFRAVDMPNGNLTLDDVFRKKNLSREEQEYLDGQIRKISRKVLYGYDGISESEREDIVQEVCVSIFKERLELQNYNYVKAYIKKVCVNEANDCLRGLKKRASKENPLDETFDIAGIGQKVFPGRYGASPEKTYGDKELLKIAFKALNEEMGSIYCEVMILNEVEGWTYEKIANKYGITVNNAHQIKFRAKQFLKSHITKIRRTG